MNNYKKILLVLLVAALPFVVVAQMEHTLKARHVILTTSLLEYLPIPLNSGNFNIGTEFVLKDRKSLYANIGIIRSYSQNAAVERWFNIPSISTKGIKLQIEGRHYLGKHKIFEPAVLLFWPHIFQYKTQTQANTGYYVALASMYQYTATEREEGIDYYNPLYVHEQNIYTVYRNAVGLNVKFGYQCIKKYGLVVDYAVGLGGQYISSISANKFGNNDDKDVFLNKPFDEGAGFYPMLTYQIRIGWQF
ncbi:MAG: hypothetical protein HOO86_13970 [Bacteroidales bacterium]|nr:hypothetical protein [Bacteroidales bacterium]